jgi:hypothetical protein
MTAIGAFASIAAIVFELGAHNHSALELTLAMLTIALSWAAVHTTFALHYAHEYYRGNKPGGLQFPSGDQHEDADYWDFVYFSFVIGMTAQVSDVGITDKIIRRTATAHGVISFFYNTALLGADGQYRGERNLTGTTRFNSCRSGHGRATKQDHGGTSDRSFRAVSGDPARRLDDQNVLAVAVKLCPIPPRTGAPRAP